MAARASVEAGLDSVTYLEASSRGLASGLFGPAYKSASDDQRAAWVEMCREALVEANIAKYGIDTVEHERRKRDSSKED